jgi:L-lactate dehydrogenase complex protein LldG
MTARDEVLARIRDALGPDRAPAPAVARDYRVAAGEGTGPPAPPAGDVLDLLVDRLEDYQAVVVRVRPDGVAAAVRAQVTEQGLRRVGVPAGLPAPWVEDLDGVEVRHDEPHLSLEELAGLDGVVTACRLAIATTGTVVLDADARQGRRALSLVPDWHLCVVQADQVVEGVPDAIARLDPTRPLTFVSGPSATSDIELERVEGVHGPRTLVVVLVDS